MLYSNLILRGGEQHAFSGFFNSYFSTWAKAFKIKLWMVKMHPYIYSSPRLVEDWMEELIVGLLLVENAWCQKQSWSFMHLLCSGMVGFGLRRNKGTAGKEHPALRIPLFPLWRSERYWRSSSVKLKGTACLQFKWCRTLVPLRPSEGGGVLFSSCSQISPKTKTKHTTTQHKGPTLFLTPYIVHQQHLHNKLLHPVHD